MTSEAENVVAEVIEEQEASELSVAYVPSTIEANFDALEAHVRAKVAGAARAPSTTSRRPRTSRRQKGTASTSTASRTRSRPAARP